MLTEAQLGVVLDNAGVGLWRWRPAEQAFVCDTFTASFFGEDPSRAQHPLDAWLRHVHPDDIDVALATFQALVTEGTSMSAVYRMHPRPGELRWVHARGIADGVGDARIVCGTVRDVTAEQFRLQELHRSEVVFDSLIEAVVITDAHLRIISVNKAFERLSGYTAEALYGHGPDRLRSGRHPAAFYDGLWQQVVRQGHWAGQVWLRARDGSAFLVQETISSVRNPQGAVTHHVIVMADITQLAVSQKVLADAHTRDPLTGAINRVVLHDRLATALSRAGRDGQPVGLAIIDLDRFHRINTAFGHAVGDALLQAVTQRLHQHLPPGGTLARTAGDEFTLLLESVGSVVEFDRILRGCLADLRRTFEVAGETIHVTACAGASICTETDETAFHRAVALALSTAKQHGPGTLRFVPKDTADGRVDDLHLEQALRQALERGDLEVWFQPQFDLLTGALIGAEALSRWRHPIWGFVSPARFIPIADDAGLIPDLNARVLDRAIGCWADWRSRGGQPGVLAINATPSELHGNLLTARVRETLSRHGLPAELLEIEVTEGAIADPSAAGRALDDLHALGVSLAIDDFGSGYSSLGRLARLPIDRLKIDRLLTRDVGSDPRAGKLVRAVVDLARSLDMAVVAEGIETPAQQVALCDAGCHTGQGFLLGRPMPAEQFQTLLTLAPVTAHPRPTRPPFPQYTPPAFEAFEPTSDDEVG